MNFSKSEILCNCRRVSNCDEATDEPVAEADGQEVAGENAEIVTPPDNLIAEELAEGPQDIQESNAVSTVKEAVKAVRTGVHLQETKKPRMTASAKQCEALTNTMISFIQKANSNQEDEADDELDLTFAGIAKQMRLHLDANQRQRVLNKIQTLVGNCIENVLEGLPLMGPPQVPFPQGQNIMQAPRQLPAANAARNNAPAGERLGFFEQAAQAIQYDENGLSFQQL